MYREDEVITGDDAYIVKAPTTNLNEDLKSDHKAFDNWKYNNTNTKYKSGNILPPINSSVVLSANVHTYKYTIKYTTSGLTGVTGTMADTPCTYGVSCPLRTPVTFKKDYYTFDKWKYNSLEIPSNANLQTDFIAKNKLDITSDNQVLNLTTIMRKNVLKVGYNSNGGSLQSAHSNRITLASNVIKVDNNAVHHTLNYDGKLTTDGLSNWNNTGWINLAKKGHTVKSGEEWNTAAAGNGKTFNQTSAYTAKELCPELKTGDCTKNMYVKWTLASYKCVAGKYLKKGDTFCTTCTSGNYCPGGTYTYNTSKDQGLTKCPSGYNKSASGSSKITQCYMEVSKNKYVKKAKDSSTTSCPSGYGKNVHNVYYNKTSSCIQKPTCSINATTNPYKGSWYKNNVIINLTRSGGPATSYGLATSKNSTNKQTSVTIKKEGTNTYYGYVSNEGGSSTCSKVIRIDKSPPTVVLYKNNEPAGGIAKDVCKPALESKGVNLKNYVFYDGIWFVWKDVYSGTTNYDGNCKSWLEWPSVFNNGRTTITSHLNSGTCRDSFPVNHKTNINELLCFRMRSKKAPGSFVVKYKLCDYVDNCVESSITYKVGT